MKTQQAISGTSTATYKLMKPELLRKILVKQIQVSAGIESLNPQSSGHDAHALTLSHNLALAHFFRKLLALHHPAAGKNCTVIK